MTHSTNRPVLIFGREPAVLISLVQGLVAFLAMFVVPLTQTQSTSIVAVVNAGLGLYVAYVVRPITPAVITALLQAVLALLVGFGLDLSLAAQGTILTVAAVVLNTVMIRPQVTPTLTLRARA